jgi:hypothetical protein
MNYFSKYTRQYVFIFLSAYLFLISLTIFHYHHYNFQQGIYNFEQVPKDQPANPFDKFFNLNGECVVEHFVSTIDKINYVPALSPETANIEVDQLLNNHNKVPKQEFNHNPQLRAPPVKYS